MQKGHVPFLFARWGAHFDQTARSFLLQKTRRPALVGLCRQEGTGILRLGKAGRTEQKRHRKNRKLHPACLLPLTGLAETDRSDGPFLGPVSLSIWATCAG